MKIFKLFFPEPADGGGGDNKPPAGDQKPGDFVGLLAQPITLDPTAIEKLVPQEYRAHPAMANLIKSGNLQEFTANLTKSYVGAQEAFGADKMLKPQPTWTPEQHAEFYKQLGRPDKPEGYTIPTPKDAPADFKLDEKFTKEFLAKAHELGLTQKQLEGSMGWYQALAINSTKALAASKEKARVDAETALKTVWGEHQYNERMNLAQVTVRTFFGAKEGASAAETAAANTLAEKVFKDVGITNNPEFIMLLSNIGQSLLEDNAGGGGGRGFQMTVDQAKAEIDRLKTGEEGVKTASKLANVHIPTNKAFAEEWERLNRIASGGKA